MDNNFKKQLKNFIALGQSLLLQIEANESESVSVKKIQVPLKKEQRARRNDEIVGCYNRGLKLREIAATYEMSQPRVSQILKENGVKRVRKTAYKSL